MQQRWDAFIDATPALHDCSLDVVAILSRCFIHDCEFQPVTDVEQPRVRDTVEYANACQERFPFAKPVETDDGAKSCCQCTASRTEWINTHPELANILQRRTTYEEFALRRYPELTDRPDFAAAIAARTTEIAAQMNDGDELWEWDAGGWHFLSGSAGVAIVRDGLIVQQWCELRS